MSQSLEHVLNHCRSHLNYKHAGAASRLEKVAVIVHLTVLLQIMQQ